MEFSRTQLEYKLERMNILQRPLTILLCDDDIPENLYACTNFSKFGTYKGRDRNNERGKLPQNL